MLLAKAADAPWAVAVAISLFVIATGIVVCAVVDLFKQVLTKGSSPNGENEE